MGLVYYNGINADPGYVHTEERFIKVMEKLVDETKWNELNPVLREIKCEYKEGWVLPDDFIFFTLQDWIDYSGAVYFA